MQTLAEPSASPILVLAQARTGSTLMRYVIDSHPDVCCPPELALGRLCRDLRYTLTLTMGPESDDGEAQRRDAVRRAVRSHLDQIMRTYCMAKGKARWCEKSANNIEHLDVLSDVFPDAQFICLHRGCLDVVHSLIEMFRYGYPGRYGELVARSPGNVVDAMVERWLEATEALLRFEDTHRERCFRLTYEALVGDPVPVLSRLFAFLQLTFDETLLDRVFSATRDPGPGDIKIQFTSKIEKGRVGKGAQIPRQRLAPALVARVDHLHRTLGLPIVGEGTQSDLHRAISASNARPVTQDRWG